MILQLKLVKTYLSPLRRGEKRRLKSGNYLGFYCEVLLKKSGQDLPPSEDVYSEMNIKGETGRLGERLEYWSYISSLHKRYNVNGVNINAEIKTEVATVVLVEITIRTYETVKYGGKQQVLLSKAFVGGGEIDYISRSLSMY